jgi:iron complex outermembrane receptor protein
MSSQQTIALTPLAAAISAALAPATAVQAQQQGAALEEIVVTARKREETAQEIPASIQAIGQIQLEKMGAKGVEDYSRFIPALNAVSYRPGSYDIVIRGVNAGGTGGVAQSPASMYLDEMPITTTGSQPEVRMYDINRVESLEGPQGTLFGGSAQSGTLRVITNQPDPTQFEAGAAVQLKQGPDTGFSHDVSGMLNLPFGDGKGALRLVGFTATEAGFIDNVFGHTPDTHEWYTLPATWGTEDNADVVEDDWNDVDFNGGRISLGWDFNDKWAATLSYNYQKSEGHGGNHFDPYVGDLQVVKFNKEFRNDRWESYGLVVEGDLGWAQLVSSTSYYDRSYDFQSDSTVYVKYYQAWACLYQWDPTYYTGYFVDPTTGYALYYPRYCFGPSSLSDVESVQETWSWVDRFAQELRLSGGTDNIDWIVGLFYERTHDSWKSPWGIATNFDYQDSVANLYWEWVRGPGYSVPDATHGWDSNSAISWEQKAIFGEVTWRINDQWTTTVGARSFSRDMDSTYWVENPNTYINEEFQQSGIAISKGGTDDFVTKFSVSYNLSDDKMIYALFSEGFRPGGTNRGRGDPILPHVFDADKLQNTEVGLKSIWADGRVRVNLTWYDMQWEDYQLSVLDPSYYNEPPEPWQEVIANVGDASVSGIQGDFEILLGEGLTFGGNLISLDAKTETNVDLDGNPDEFGTPQEFEVQAGWRLPLSVEFKASAWLDYTWQTSFIPGTMFARLQWSHTGDTVNQLRSNDTANPANPQHTTPSWEVVDFRLGLIADAEWEVDLFINNLTDERAQYTRASGFFEEPFSSVQDGRAGVGRIYTNRPLEFGVRFSKHWSD